MPIRRGRLVGDRPTIEFNGKTYKFDYDVILTDGDSIAREGEGLRIRSRHESKHGAYTSEISHPDAILREPAALHKEFSPHMNDMFGVYIHAPD